MHLTDMDHTLLALLKDNARLPISELAKRLDVARTTARNRLERLERMGVITGYTVRLSDRYMRSLIEAHVLLKLDPKRATLSLKTIAKFDELTDLYSISGEYDCVAIIKADSSERLDEILISIRNMESIVQTQSSIILTKWIQR